MENHLPPTDHISFKCQLTFWLGECILYTKSASYQSALISAAQYMYCFFCCWSSSFHIDATFYLFLLNFVVHGATRTHISFGSLIMRNVSHQLRSNRNVTFFSFSLINKCLHRKRMHQMMKDNGIHGDAQEQKKYKYVEMIVNNKTHILVKQAIMVMMNGSSVRFSSVAMQLQFESHRCKYFRPLFFCHISSNPLMGGKNSVCKPYEERWMQDLLS